MIWTVVGQILLGLIQLATAYITKKPDPYEKARDAQAKAYEEAGAILEGRGEDLTRMAAIRARLCRSLLRSRSLQSKTTSDPG